MSDLNQNLIATAVIVAGAIAARLLAGRIIRRETWSSVEDQRRWLVHARNVTLLLAFLGLVVVWAEQLRTAALSLVAFAVATVIAGKELIMGVSGSFTRAASGSFSVGDRIRIGDYRGDVIDHSLLTTTLLEIGPGHVRTGRTLVLPNSKLVTDVVANETKGHDYVLHSFVVPVAQADWQRARAALLEAAHALTDGYVEEARANMEESAKEHALSVPIVEPFVLAKPTSPGTVDLTVRVPVPSRDLWRIEHEIVEAWLTAMDEDDLDGDAVTRDPDPTES